MPLRMRFEKRPTLDLGFLEKWDLHGLSGLGSALFLKLMQP